jgi:hypothetical protein
MTSSHQTSLEQAVKVLAEHGPQLFSNPEQAAQFGALLKQICVPQVSEQPGSEATRADQSALQDAELAELQALVHTIASIEDKVHEVQHAADTILDWVAKSGRSLGLD